jgi:hypothetical protein
MASPYLTKSDFKACLHCRTKLFYRKNSYPSNSDENEYLRFLADGGFMVEFIAKAQHPTGVDLVSERNPLEAFARTQALIDAGDVTIFEAGVVSGSYYVRTDILRREGNILHLIEVKSASLGEDGGGDSPFLTNKGTVDSRWREYLMDVAFQAHVLQLAFPQLRVKPYLCVINKTTRVTETETLNRFALMKDAARPTSRPDVSYRGSSADLFGSKLLRTVAVDREIALVMDDVLKTAGELAALLTPNGVTRFQEDIAVHYRNCRTCEYRVADSDRNGFRECWGALGRVVPHILDLHRVGQIGSKTKEDPVTPLLRRGKASILDLEESDLGNEGSYQERRFIQWDSMRGQNAEHLPTALTSEIQSHRQAPGWPLHFVDFEACNIALPHHVGLRPYERVAFQWSCHTLHADGRVSHAEWLNTERDFPNFAFARSLRDILGDEGTVYVWSPYEQGTLKNVLEQIATWTHHDIAEAVRVSGLKDSAALDELADWIDELLGPEDAEGKRHSHRIRDLHRLALQHYFHPRMGGRTSIKVVLPAVWGSNEALWTRPEFQKYFRRDENGNVMDPYKVLPALPLGADDDSDDAVREGTGAIRVYQDLIFSSDGSPEHHAHRRQLLLQYCELDTAAMVMIWRHWARVVV